MTAPLTPERLAQVRARELVLAEYGRCVRDDDSPLCVGGHNDGYMDYHDDTCDQFESWVAGAVLALAALDAAEERAERAEGALARVEAERNELGCALWLALIDAHPAYGSTALWHGGIGGQAITGHCSFINGSPPGDEWAELDMLQAPLREWAATTEGAQQMRDDYLARLRKQAREAMEGKP